MEDMMKRRKPISASMKKEVWAKTGGRCHFCARKIKLSAKIGERGRWHVDHIYPKALGGKDGLDNYLPICKQCNRLRWFLNSKRIRKTFKYGVLAYNEMKRKTDLGKILHALYLKNRKNNKDRRKKD